MRCRKNILVAVTGLFVMVLATMVIANPFPLITYEYHRNNLKPHELQAAANDRYGDYIMCTGAVAVNPRSPMDGVWMLDYRSGKLLGTVIDRTVGKIIGWSEVDLVTEYNIPPRTDVHFMMTTGTITLGQSALYVAEVTTGKFGVYTMAAADGGGITIRRHDLTTFRANKAPAAPAPVAAAPAQPVLPAAPANVPPVPAAPPLPNNPPPTIVPGLPPGPAPVIPGNPPQAPVLPIGQPPEPKVVPELPALPQSAPPVVPLPATPDLPLPPAGP